MKGILIVADDADTLSSIKMFPELNGYKVFTNSRGEDGRLPALAIARWPGIGTKERTL